MSTLSTPGTIPPVRWPPEYLADVISICREHGCTLDEVRGPRRFHRLVPARRAVARYLVGRGWAIGRVAKWMGGRDHTSVRYYLGLGK